MFENVNAALAHVSERMDIPMDEWVRHSGVLKDLFTQRRIDDYS